MRRLRATFLLRCVVLAACVGLFTTVFLIGRSMGWTAATVGLAVVVWLVGIEGGLLPFALERVAMRRASRKGSSISSIWFIDLGEQHRRDLQSFHDDTEDNPTIR